MEAVNLENREGIFFVYSFLGECETHPKVCVAPQACFVSLLRTRGQEDNLSP